MRHSDISENYFMQREQTTVFYFCKQHGRNIEHSGKQIVRQLLNLYAPPILDGGNCRWLEIK